jgi:hypothetical protein
VKGYRPLEFAVLEEEPGHDRLWVNAERTVLVRLWASGKVEVATRETPAHTWGPPIYLDEEKT